MNKDNLKLLAQVLADLPESRDHAMGDWVVFKRENINELVQPWGSYGVFVDYGDSRQYALAKSKSGECGTSACAAGHGALSGEPGLEKREGEHWEAYVERVYAIEPESRDCKFAFGPHWRGDTPERARKRVEYLSEHGEAPHSNWSEWGDWENWF